MTFYRYEALDNNGNSVNGVMSGADEQAVVQRLGAMGFRVQRIFPAPGQQSAQPFAAAVQYAQQELPVSLPSSVRLRSLAAFLRRMATSIRAGINVGQTVTDLANTASTGKLRRAAQDISDRMSRGARLGEAMYAHPTIFPAHIAGLIMAGELGGFLDIALDEAATSLEREYKDRLVGWFIRMLWWSSIITIPFLLPMIWFGRYMVELFEKGAASPTAALMFLAGGYLHYFFRIGLPVGVAIIAARIFQVYILGRSAGFQRAWSRMALGIPLLSRPAKSEAMSRFNWTLGRLYEAGVPPETAWDIACRASPNWAIASRLNQVRNLLSSGQPVTVALTQTGLFDADQASVLSTAETSGGLPEALKRVAGLYSDDASAGRGSARFWNTSFGCSALLLINGLIIIFATKAWFAPVVKILEDMTSGK